MAPNLQVLLLSELIRSSSEERSLLKNLGSWLGKFTIGRNRALRAQEIDPKSLIIEVLLHWSLRKLTEHNLASEGKLWMPS